MVTKLVLTLCIVQSLCVGSQGKTFLEDLTLNQDERTALDKFKAIMLPDLPHEYMKQDYYLIRWLRSRFFNLEESRELLVKNLKWRKDNNMDTIQEEDWSDFQNNYRYSLESRDKEGHIILYVNVGDWDLRNAAVGGKSERFLRYIDKAIDEVYIKIREEGDKYHNVSQAVLLLNVNGFNIVQHGCLQCVPIILRIIVTYETHFPGIADKILVLNTPAIAEPIVRAAKLTFHPDTNKGLLVLGTNKQKLREYLKSQYDLDQLPPELGGTKVYSYCKDYDNDFW